MGVGRVAYAALLRKSIGKPRILLVVRNARRLSEDLQNPFHIIFRDVFQLPPEHCYGAAILMVDQDELTASFSFEHWRKYNRCAC